MDLKLVFDKVLPLQLFYDFEHQEVVVDYLKTGLVLLVPYEDVGSAAAEVVEDLEVGFGRSDVAG